MATSELQTSEPLDQAMANIAEIIRLHDEAYDHCVTIHGIGSKGDDGRVQLDFGPVHDRRADGGVSDLSVNVYSYVLGPSRWHYFNSSAEALKAMREWHDLEMIEGEQ